MYQIDMKTPKTWTLHADCESQELIQQISKHYPLVPRHKLLRLCLRYGLRAVASNPRLLVQEAETRSPSSPHIAPCSA